MRVVDRIVTEPETCSYLRDRLASVEFRIVVEATEAQLERWLERGWRRFGVAYFRPACRGCAECVSLRIPVASFVPSRAQRRAAERAAGFRLEVGAPQVDEARLSLYRRWHASRAANRGWSPDGMDEDRYALEFAYPHAAAHEYVWYDGARPIAVSLVDRTPNALSAVYTYHDPDYARHSLGTVSILTQIEEARLSGRAHVYLGYRVSGCASSEYKARFRPHELLRGWPDLHEMPFWEPA